MMRSILALALTLAAAGASPASAAALVWSSKVSGAGMGLVLGPPGGEPVFSLACVRGTQELMAIVHNLKPVGSEDRLTLSFGQDLVVFVVKPQALKEGRVVEAAAKGRPELIAQLRNATEIRGAYGAKVIGPYPAPPKALREPFAARCTPVV